MSRHVGAQRGASLMDFMVAMVLLSIAILAAVPLVAERVQAAKVRTAANQLAIDLRAARMIAVTNRNAVDMTFAVDPGNTYSYPDIRGTLREVRLPAGVRIASSDSPLRFQPNGSVPGGGTTVLEADLAGGTLERWTVTTNTIGVPSIVKERIEP